MGYIRNETMVVSGWDAARVLRAHSAASAIFDGHKIGRLVSGLVQHITNGGAAFFISPDGSKEGWHDSDLGEAARNEFISWLNTDEAKKLYLDWALIVLGGDDGEFIVSKCTNLDDVGNSVEDRVSEHRIMYVCTECADGSPEGCGHYDRNDLRLVPDGRWLCESCFDDTDQTERGNTTDDGEFMSWCDLPAPPAYGPVPSDQLGSEK